MKESGLAWDIYKNDQIIFCSEEAGPYPPRGHISYVASEQGKKIDVCTGIHFQKSPLEGRLTLQREFAALLQLDSDTRQMVSSFYKVDPYTGETYLRLPSHMAVQHITSQEALRNMLDGTLAIPQELVDTYGTAIEWLLKNSDICAEDLGIYGGLGAGLYAPQAGGKTDVDLTVKGEHYAHDVRKVCRNHQPASVSALLEQKLAEASSGGLYRQDVLVRSPQRAIHPPDAAFFIDTIVVRDSKDVQIAYPVIEDNNQVIGVTTLDIVVDDTVHGLALPVYFGAHLQDASTKIHIYSPRYRYLAVFAEGTRARIQGLEIDTGKNNERTILLVNPDEHSIEYE